MASRTFTLEDQRRFAALSGDSNPLHLDAAVARRSMLGGVAAHGIHVLLWALDQLAAIDSFGGFERLRVSFDRGVLVDDKVQCGWDKTGPRWEGRVFNATGILARISLIPAAITPAPWSGPDQPPAMACEEHEFSDLAGASGELELSLPSTWREDFPHLAAGDSALMVAVLLASTRLVGMRCPGRQSIYSALDLKYRPPTRPADPQEPRLHYKVICADPRVRILDLAIEAGPFCGTVNTLVRPKPVAQPNLEAVRQLVAPSRYAGCHALVVGGSRGLGELASKILAAGGANVTLTWRQGEADARALVSEALNLELNLSCLRFDTAAPPEGAALPASPYTHLYYFPTPHIRKGKRGHFNSSAFAGFMECYVSGFARTVEWFRPRAIAGAHVWYPSSVFVDEMNPDFPEYTAAKICGEALCRQLAAQLAPMTFAIPRLPRLPTDQTQTLTGIPLTDSIAILLKAIGEPKDISPG
jgi:hypothetical protein